MTSPSPAPMPPLHHQPPPPRQPGEDAWRRSSTDRVVAGVCGGLGRRLGIDPVILRVVVVVLAFFAGAGVVLYATAWLLMPLDRTGQSVVSEALGSQSSDRTRSVLTAIALVGALVIGLVVLADGGFVPGVLIALVLVAILLVVRRDELEHPRPMPGYPPSSPWPSTGPQPARPATDPAGTGDPGRPADPASPDAADETRRTTTASTAASGEATVVLPDSGDRAAADRAASEPTAGEPTPAVDPDGPTAAAEPTRPLERDQPTSGPIPPVPPHAPVPAQSAGFWDPPYDQPPPPPPYQPAGMPVPPAPPAPPKERSYLGVLTVSAMLAAIGVLAIVDLAGIAVPAAAYVVTALAVVAAGLLLGAWFGRSRGLIVLGAALTVALGPAVVVDAVVGSDWGAWRNADEVRQVPRTPDDLAPSYEYGAGSVHLDLTRLDFTGEDLITNIDLGAGEVRITVPPDVDVTVEGSVQVGDLVVFDRRSSGFDADAAFTDRGSDGIGGGQLTLFIDLGLGSVEVRRAAS